VLDTQAYPHGEQLTWLENDLAAHSSAKWKIALFNFSPFCMLEHGEHSLLKLREYWVPLFDKYHVNLVINGRERYYERTYPINYTKWENEPAPSSREGTTYIMTGSWGYSTVSERYYQWGAVSWENTWTPQWWTARAVPGQHNFLLLTATENTLVVKAMTPTGEVFDEVTLLPSEEKKGFSPIIFISVSILAIACTVIGFYLVKMRKSY
jgi:hypothetical protein